MTTNYTSPSQTKAAEEAARLAGEAQGAGKQVTDVAKEESKKVAGEVRAQAGNLMQDTGSELREQAASYQTRIAEGLASLGTQLSDMADTATDQGMASDLARQAAERVRGVGHWLEMRDPAGVLEEVKGFARRRPAVFLGLAVGAGLLAGRLTRALAAPSTDSTDSNAQHAQPGMHAQGVRRPEESAEVRAAREAARARGVAAGVPQQTGSEEWPMGRDSYDR